jgi:hypothetical protein
VRETRRVYRPMNKVISSYLSFTLSHVRSILKHALLKLDDPEEAVCVRAMRDVWGIFERIGEDFSIRLSLEDPNWHEIDDETFSRYLRRVFDEIRHVAANAERDNAEREGSQPDDDTPYDPYVSNLLLVLSLMQTHARSLGLDGRLVDLGTFNPTGALGRPTRSDLAPYRSH